MRLTGPLAGFSFLVAGLLACGGEPTRPAVPTSVSVTPPTVSLSAFGATQQITATVRDQDSQPIVGLTTTFASGDLAVATVGGSGLVTAVANGVTAITVSHGSISAQVPVTVVQIVAQLAKVGGDQQTGLVSSPLGAAVQVELQDSKGNPVLGGGNAVQFVASPGGSVTNALVTAGPNGRASTQWTLGSGTGTQLLTATHRGGTASAQFSANAVAVGGYTLEIRYLPGTSPTANQQSAVTSAVTLWQSIILGDLAPVAVNIPADACATGQPALNETIDDMVVFVEFAAIDGPGGTLAQAGRCDIQPPNPPFRGSTDSLPAIGVLRLDTSDLPLLESNGTLDEVITHELGHTLGFSADFFVLKGLLVNPSRPSSPGVDTHFDGTAAIAQMDAIGGAGYPNAKVPVENSALAGSADSHWRESVFDAELLTPVAENAGAMPLSKVSAAALQDLGYVVNLAAAQLFSLSFPALAGAAGRTKVPYGNDVVFIGLPASAAVPRASR
jgi:hypothetical protein